jgi:hypothetical protein
VPEDTIGKAGVAQVLPGDVVKCLGPVAGPHAVDLHDDEPELSDLLHAQLRRECFRDE